ncbi:peptidylprolyl isomerase [Flavobacteriaceae bacterium S0825]|uniref:peptidylprolyl isomerase n=1 Tax=Gaetbulibacter sp. S0825 TaxID=2720084 RepID=UPI0014307E97|nr:peptidylprolyl isomerase [Gaetbulibacter sp. S0825]MCK0109095.1 peptidylprolyl isomerase [Flavobacteriaceae bacterium S0825]NIX64730.1 peptidylprolyl isomerase [Gaetbulibacter sp. S0825]
MKTYIVSACVVLFFSFFGNAQSSNNDVLFTVNNEPVLASEFLRVYNKNLNLVQDESQKDVDQYLSLFVNYKLKLAEAKALNFHKKPAYVRELDGYKKQLAKNYMVDSEVTDVLVKEAYDRVLYDINAKHILIMLDPSRNDTLEVYNRLLNLRERFKNEDYNDLKKELHNGNTILVEDLGYFSAFKMVYDFETEAYKTKIGDVSMPFRTQFGYHIVKVFDKRKSRGEITAGHIMISKNQKDTTEDPEIRIKEIYKLIEQGQEFESLAKQFSQDKSSSSKGGKLAPFTGGQLSSVVFENKAFNLQEDGAISKPFESEYGWHIVKRFSIKPIGSFEDMQYELENKVSRDSRSKLINTSMQNKLRKQYNVSNTNPSREYFVSILNDDFYDRKWQIPKGFDKAKTILTIGGKRWNNKDFASILRSQQKGNTKGKSFESIIDEAFEAFANKCVLMYHEENLENVNQEFAQILNEYREGLLLFDLMETKIWNATKNDTLGIESYYNKNKQNYKWNTRVEAIVGTASQEDDIKEVVNMLKKGEEVDSIKEKLNTNGKQKVIFTSGTMDADHQALPNNFEFKEGISKVYSQNNVYYVVKVTKLIPESFRTLDEARGMVINDYQQEVEQNWINNLKSKYEVTINKDVLRKVKTQIHN